MIKTKIDTVKGFQDFLPPESLKRNVVKKTIEKYIKKKYKFVIICGGGKLARGFQEVASKSKKLSNQELDWLGIYATKINAFLLKSIFNEHAENEIISNPNQKIKFRKTFRQKYSMCALKRLKGKNITFLSWILQKALI
jgi:uridylate kinase